MAETKSSFSESQIKTAEQAIMDRKSYLQSQAAAWTILTEQHRTGLYPNKRAQDIALESTNISSESEWRKNQLMVQTKLATDRCVSLGLELVEEEDLGLLPYICEQLKLYSIKSCEKYWNSYLEILLGYAENDLRHYKICIRDMLVDVDDKWTQRDLDWNFTCVGLTTSPLPVHTMPQTTIVAKKESCISTIRSFIVRHATRGRNSSAK